LNFKFWPQNGGHCRQVIAFLRWSFISVLTQLVFLFFRCQFHQHFTRGFFCTKVLFCQNVTREKLCEALSYEKRERKILIKLTTGQSACLQCPQSDASSTQFHRIGLSSVFECNRVHRSNWNLQVRLQGPIYKDFMHLNVFILFWHIARFLNKRLKVK